MEVDFVVEMRAGLQEPADQEQEDLLCKSFLI